MSEIVERFTRILRNDPHRPLLHLPSTGITLTATDVWTRAASIRDRLRAAKLPPGRPILSLAGNLPDTVPLLLACRAAGTPLMPVDASTALPEVLDLSARFAAAALVRPTGAPPPRGTVVSPLCAALDVLTFPPASNVPEYPDAAVLKLTSGSTGLPKATITSEAALVNDTLHITDAMGIGPADTQLAAIPLSHAYGLGNLAVTLLVQGTAIVLRETFVPHQLRTDAERYGARVFPGVPFMFDHFSANPPAGGWPACLSQLVSAGARLEAATVRRFHDRFGVKVHSFYGTTETGGIAFDDTDDVRDETTVGRPLHGVTVALRPGDGAPPGGGRVHVAGDAVASEYAGDDGADVFVDGGFLTGDLGRFDARGHLVLTGRVSSFINVAGRKVQPFEIEQILAGMPGVADVRVLGVADALRGQQIVACVVPRAAGLDAVSVRQFCAAHLAPYKVPRSVLILDALPLTSRGKLDRRALEARAEAEIAGNRPKNPML
ncbi:MAG: long-chain acyl-CoA synthetase [Acidobacteriota bacterium]|jgi:long-chain acyl-CoA synthetase